MLAAHPWEEVVGITRGSMAQPLQLAPSEVSWLGVARTEQRGRRRLVHFWLSPLQQAVCFSGIPWSSACFDCVRLCCARKQTAAGRLPGPRLQVPPPTPLSGMRWTMYVQTEIGRMQLARFPSFPCSLHLAVDGLVRVPWLSSPSVSGPGSMTSSKRLFLSGVVLFLPCSVSPASTPAASLFPPPPCLRVQIPGSWIQTQCPGGTVPSRDGVFRPNRRNKLI